LKFIDSYQNLKFIIRNIDHADSKTFLQPTPNFYFFYPLYLKYNANTRERDLIDSLYKGYSVGYVFTLESSEKVELSDPFWNFGLTQRLDTSVASRHLSCMVKGQYKGFMSRFIDVADIILFNGNINHIFSKNYLKKNNKSRDEYNHIANYVLNKEEILEAQ
jgi:hypothetical protein